MHYVPQVKKAIKLKRCLFGTVDTWLLWVSHISIISAIFQKYTSLQTCSDVANGNFKIIVTLTGCTPIPALFNND